MGEKASMIPWEAIEEKYAALFPGKTGMPAKPLRMALGSLLIQKQLGFSDRELVEEIIENPYFQYFIGLPGYQTDAPFVPSLLVEIRKRLNDEVLNEINKMIIAFNTPDDPTPGGGNPTDEDALAESKENTGTLVLDATCAPQNKKYPQDVSLDERGMARIKRMSFDAYNESDVLKQAVENYKDRTGHYPERVLVDQIYQPRANLAFCKERGIRVSGPALGRPKKNFKADKKVEYKDNTDLIAVERAFALAKHSYGLGLVVTKRGERTRSSIALSILAMDLSRIIVGSLRHFWILIFSGYKHRKDTLTFIQSKCYKDLADC